MNLVINNKKCWDLKLVNKNICSPNCDTLIPDSSGITLCEDYCISVDCFSLANICGTPSCVEVSGNTFQFNGGFISTKWENSNNFTIEFDVQSDIYTSSTIIQNSNLYCHRPIETIQEELSANTSGDTFCVNLDEIVPNNQGTLLYIGLNKLPDNCYITDPCNINLTAITENCVANDFELLEYIEQSDTNGENPFLYYQGCNTKPNNYAEIKVNDCGELLCNNAFSIRINEESKIGYRYITCSGDCSGNTVQIIEEMYSDNSISINNLSKFSFTYDTQECDEYAYISIFLDGKLKLRNKITKFDNDTEKILSIGGGTLGNVCNTDLPLNALCISTYCGLFENNTEINSVITTSGETIELNIPVNELSSYSDQLCASEITVEQHCLCGKFYYYICINNSRIEIDYLLIYGEEYYFSCIDKKIVELNTDNTLEEYFIGNFIGEISNFQLFNSTKNISQIRCENYIQSDKCM